MAISLARSEGRGRLRPLRLVWGRGWGTGRELIGWEAGRRGWFCPALARIPVGWSGGRESRSLLSPSDGAVVPRPVPRRPAGTHDCREPPQAVRLGAGPRERQSAACHGDHEERPDPRGGLREQPRHLLKGKRVRRRGGGSPAPRPCLCSACAVSARTEGLGSGWAGALSGPHTPPVDIGLPSFPNFTSRLRRGGQLCELIDKRLESSAHSCLSSRSCEGTATSPCQWPCDRPRSY